MFFDKFKALPGQQNHVLIAAGLTIFAGLCFAGLSAQVKFLTSDLHGFVITFWRNFWGLFFMLPWLFRQGLGELSWPRIRMFTLRSALSLVSMLFGFTSLSYLTLANATALSFTAPLFATILAALVLGETVRRRRWSATLVGFIGVLIVLRPGHERDRDRRDPGAGRRVPDRSGHHRGQADVAHRAQQRHRRLHGAAADADVPGGGVAVLELAGRAIGCSWSAWASPGPSATCAGPAPSPWPMPRWWCRSIICG